VRVTADLDLCQGHAMCVLEAPEVFAADDQVQILQPQPPEDQRANVRNAIAYCPTTALTLMEDDDV
jgi:ferredoxin